MNVYDTLEERGFVDQMTHADEIKDKLNNDKVTFYIGYDPTADSLTIGGLVTIMAAVHLQRAGHRPIMLLGGGTGMIGDPTDKMEARKMMTPEQIAANLEGIREQLARFLDFSSEDKGLFVNNGDWLMGLGYVETLRNVCIHFSVNRMLTADAFKTRMERDAGLTLFELNYMVMQAYDFLHLNRQYGCTMQMGGRDQWSNIIAGADLVRRVDRKAAYGLTFPLLTRFDGEKMGKSLDGAIYLDANKTSPYEFFQYLRNTDDRDVVKFMKLFTFLQIDEIERMAEENINEAKKILAYDVTARVHGEQAAQDAMAAAAALFGGGGDTSAMPVTELNASDLADLTLTGLLVKTALAPSNSEARRLNTQGGVSLAGVKVEDPNRPITSADFADGELIVKKGKKVFHKAKLV